MTNVSYPVDDHIFERSFYSHQGWNTERDGGGTAYRAGDHIFCTRDLTLYAQWDLIDDITYDNNVFTIEADGEYVITGNTNGNSVKVAPDVTATVTLKDASIVMNDGCAFDVEAGATVTLVLEGTNTLKSGGDNAGLHVPVDAAIIITSASGDGSTDGVLHVTGGDASAGIGGNASRYVYVDRVNNIRTPGDAGTIIIKGGTITATGGNGREDGHGGGAGIGGGGANPGYDTGCKGGDGGIVTITGGHVTARGGDGYPLPGHIESENSRFNGAGAGIGGGGGADLVGSGGEATYSGPGEPIQATVSWEGWNDSRTAFVSATAGTSQGGAQAIGYGGHGSY
jgi:hypothetical protein